MVFYKVLHNVLASGKTSKKLKRLQLLKYFARAQISDQIPIYPAKQHKNNITNDVNEIQRCTQNNSINSVLANRLWTPPDLTFVFSWSSMTYPASTMIVDQL